MSHSHLTLEERISIEIFVSMGLSCREMARRLGRSHSTLLENALIQFGLQKVLAKGFNFITVPDLVSSKVLEGKQSEILALLP